MCYFGLGPTLLERSSFCACMRTLLFVYAIFKEVGMYSVEVFLVCTSSRSCKIIHSEVVCAHMCVFI